jgi:hypothetical protein
MEQSGTKRNTEKNPLLALALASGTAIADASKPRRGSGAVADFAEWSLFLKRTATN